jgi:hypothetical protein
MGVTISMKEAKVAVKVRPDSRFEMVDEMANGVGGHREPEPSIAKLDHSKP